MDYREVLYQRYVQSRLTSPAPASIENLAPRSSYLERLIRLHFPYDRNAVIVEVGCGHGALIHFARRLGYQNVTGFDRSPEQVAAARRLGIDGVREGDLFSALRAQANESVDVVVAFDVIEHLTKDELMEFAAATHRVLRCGGRCIVHTPNGGSPFFGMIRYGDLTHEQAFTREAISQLFLAYGFSSIKSYEDTPVPRGIRSAARWIVWKCIRGILRLYLAAETGAGGKDHILTQNLLAVAVK
ncbi:MAG: methyltransferase domain-containing protein [Sulfuricaulis sp.]|uniref:class I SAM-dependent methyltransferase n=1 Tax=Sulfuricaulis sp. TaxID=2003553 RepID=UPI0025DD7395|nr:class I SAM-dependent methyltransferase [Sulfuricaulis sp.]MCR4348034.1 methyltransferase domain-containing protein [Sulfuricaulis sp.]